MIKKIILRISAAAVFATSAIANDLYTLKDVSVFGAEYLKKLAIQIFTKRLII